MSSGLSPPVLVLLLLVIAITAGSFLWFRRASRRGLVYPSSRRFPFVSTRGGGADRLLDVWPDLDESKILAQLHAIAYNGACAPGAQSRYQDPVHEEIRDACSRTLARTSPDARHLPRRPLLLPKLMSAASDEATSSRDIAAIIAQDPTLSGNLLRIANSPLYRVRRTPVESIERAVTTIGNNGMRQLIAIVLMQPVMGSGADVFSRLSSVLWEHTLLSALAAVEQVDMDRAFDVHMLSLLYGLGSIVVIRIVRDAYFRHPAIVPEPAVADSLLDAWSAAVMKQLVRAWDLPESIMSGVCGERAGVPWRETSLIGRVLRTGRIAGAATLLYKNGDIDQDAALELLGKCGLQKNMTADVWKRLTQVA